jgi:hypothetical protein
MVTLDTLDNLQWTHIPSLGGLTNSVSEPFAESAFQSGGQNVAQASPYHTGLVSYSPASIRWSTDTGGLLNVGYKTHSESSWKRLSQFRPTTESQDFSSTFSIIPSQQPSRDASHSSRSPLNPTSNLTYNRTPPTDSITFDTSAPISSTVVGYYVGVGKSGEMHVKFKDYM